MRRGRLDDDLSRFGRANAACPDGNLTVPRRSSLQRRCRIEGQAMVGPEWEKNPLLLMGFMAVLLLLLGGKDFIPPCQTAAGLLWLLSAVCALGVGVSQRYGYTRLGWFFLGVLVVAAFVAISIDLVTALSKPRSND